MEKVREYLLKKHPNLFEKKVQTRDKGKLVKTEYIKVEPIITETATHYRVSTHKDASPLILSKEI